MNAIYLYAVFD